MQNKLKSLISLLDDSNIEVVHEAMAELLKHETEIDEYLAKHQESTNPELRKRIHQLQAIMIMRQRRESFAKLLNSKDLNLVDGLIAVHLQWYDNDSERFLNDLWERFLKASKRFAPKNISEIAYFMRKCGFETTSTDELQADSFCLGPILDDLVGADFILCAIAAQLAKEWGVELEIVRIMNNFLLIDEHGKALSPANSWQLLSDVNSQKCEFWSKKQILELASTMLFSFSVGSNSFRYIHTIGHSLAKVLGEEKLDFLPYPYGAKKEKK
jgi:Transglutaminase-like superfamily